MVKITFLHVATILYASLNEKCKLQYATKQECSYPVTVGVNVDRRSMYDFINVGGESVSVTSLRS